MSHTLLLFLLCVPQLVDDRRKDYFCFCLIKAPFFSQVLEADNNSIEHLEGVYHLPKLEEVLLKNNKISSLADLQPLASCLKLKRLDLRGNPVTQVANVESEVAELLPSVSDLLL